MNDKNYFSRLWSRAYDAAIKSNLFRFFISILLAVPIAAVILGIFLSSYQGATNEILNYRKAKTELTVTLMHERLIKITDIGKSLASRPMLIESIKTNEWEEALKYVENAPREFEYIDSVFLLQVDGTLKAGTGSYQKIIDKNFAYRDYYQGVSKDWEPYLSEFYKRANEPQINVVSAAVPIFDVIDLTDKKDMQNAVLGILVIQVNPEIFLQWSLEADLEEYGLLFAVDKNGVLIFHPDYDTANEFIDFSNTYPVKKVLGNESGIEVVYDTKRAEDVLYSYASCQSCEEHGLSIVFEQPASEAFATRDQNMILRLYLYLFFILIIIFLISMILKYAVHKRKISEIISQLAFVADNSDDAIYSRDLNGKIISWNRGAEKIYGYKKEEALHQSTSVLVPKKKMKEYYALQKKALAGERIHKLITSRLKKDGSGITVSLSTSTVKDMRGNVTGLSSIVRDITEEIKNQKLLAQRANNLEELNRELASFSYSVSHDLRSPLRGIDGFSKALMEDYYEKLDDKAKDYLQRIRKASQKMGDLIDDMLLLSRVTRNEMIFKQVDLSAIAGNISSGFLDEAGNKNRTIELKMQPNIFVYGDEKLLRILMFNLLENAMKFSQKKHHTLIEFGYRYMDKKKVLFVRDNGAGFDMRYVDKIFHPFQRLHLEKEFQGTGIGLATARRIIERHKGRIWAEGEIGKGAVFYFIFPKMRIF